MKLLHLSAVLTEGRNDRGISRSDFASDEEYLEYLDAMVDAITGRIEIVHQQMRSLSKQEILVTTIRDQTPSQLHRSSLSDKDYVRLELPKELDPDGVWSPYDVYWLKKTHLSLMEKIKRLIIADTKVLPDRQHEFLREAKKVRKAITAKRMAALQTSNKKGAAPATIPEKISIGNNKSILNPYHQADKKTAYAGPPAHYPDLSSPMKQMFIKFNDALESLGHEGITTLYAGRRNGYINFIGIGAGGKFVWRKYQTGAQNGMNTSYINGFALQSSRLMSNPKAFIRQHLGDAGV